VQKNKVYQSSTFSALFILILLFSSFVFASPGGGKKGPEQYKYLPGSLVVKLKAQPAGLLKGKPGVEAALTNLLIKYGIQSVSKAYETAKLKNRD